MLQVPSCERLMGLTLLRRVMLRLSLAIKDFAGTPGLQSTPVVLHVQEQDCEKTVEEMQSNDFFGFRGENVFIIKAKEEHGFSWSNEERMFVLVSWLSPLHASVDHLLTLAMAPFRYC